MHARAGPDQPPRGGGFGPGHQHGLCTGPPKPRTGTGRAGLALAPPPAGNCAALRTTGGVDLMRPKRPRDGFRSGERALGKSLGGRERGHPRPSPRTRRAGPARLCPQRGLDVRVVVSGPGSLAAPGVVHLQDRPAGAPARTTCPLTGRPRPNPMLRNGARRAAMSLAGQGGHAGRGTPASGVVSSAGDPGT